MHRAIIAIILLSIILASCSLARPTPTVVPATTSTADEPTSAADATVNATRPVMLTATPSITPVPQAVLNSRAALSPFPGIPGCDSLLTFPKGAPFEVTGAFNDFVQVVRRSASSEIYEGFLPKAKLDGLPGNLPELTADQVPWKPVADYRHWEFYSPDDGGSIVSAPVREEESDYVNDATHYTVQPPLRFHFGLKSTSAPWAGVRIMGSEESDTGVWWQGIIRMDVFTGEGIYHLGIRDGSKEDFNALFDVRIPSDQAITLIFGDSNGKTVKVLDNQGDEIFSIDLTQIPGLALPNGLFPFGWFQFGTTVGPPGVLRVTGLQITTLPAGVYQESWETEAGLAELAAPHGIWIGSEIGMDYMHDERYCKIAKHDFNLAYISAFTDAKVWLAPGSYDFEILDYIVNSLFDQGFTLYASHLVWGTTDSGGLPDWLKKGNYSKQELLAILEQHVTTLTKRYKDKVTIWSIANEAPERDRYRGADFWFDHIGAEYIEKSLQWARAGDPDGILILNSANNESPRDADTTYNINRMAEIVADFKARGIPVDAVGMQMHLFLPWTSPIAPVKEDVVATMKRFGDLGVKVMITEMDVDLHELKGTPEEKQQVQTQLYADMMSACLESGVCIAFSTWGVSDAVSWITCEYAWCVYKGVKTDAAPLMFDEQYQPKPAYFAVRDVLINAGQ